MFIIIFSSGVIFSEYSEIEKRVIEELKITEIFQNEISTNKKIISENVEWRKLVEYSMKPIQICGIWFNNSTYRILWRGSNKLNAIKKAKERAIYLLGNGRISYGIKTDRIRGLANYPEIGFSWQRYAKKLGLNDKYFHVIKEWVHSSNKYYYVIVEVKYNELKDIVLLTGKYRNEPYQ